jgi:hypothetical protein
MGRSNGHGKVLPGVWPPACRLVVVQVGAWTENGRVETQTTIYPVLGVEVRVDPVDDECTQYSPVIVDEGIRIRALRGYDTNFEIVACTWPVEEDEHQLESVIKQVTREALKSEERRQQRFADRNICGAERKTMNRYSQPNRGER